MNDDTHASLPLASLAMTRAEESHARVAAHEELCAERYAHIQTLIGNVKDTVATAMKIIGWGGATMFMLLLTCLGFFASRSMNTNDDQLVKLQGQIVQMQIRQNSDGVRENNRALQSRGERGERGIQGERGAAGE